MQNIFLLKLILSFITGGIWITSTTLLAQNFGSRVGGIISGLPSTMVVALLFVALSEGPDAAAKTAVVVAASTGTLCILMLSYASTLYKGFPFAIITAISAWMILQLLLINVGVLNIYSTSLLSFSVLAVAIIIFEKILKVKSVSGTKVQLTFSMILIRALLSGTIVATAVLLAKFSGPTLAGIFSAFPAVMLTTLFITHRKSGADFSRAISKTIMIGGVFNCVIYAIGVHFLYPSFGILIGTISAYSISIVSGIFTYLFVKRYIS